MSMKRKTIATIAIMAGLVVLGGTAHAMSLPIDDAKILINRALNSPTLTIQYSGVNAATVELLINGTSFGTRTVSSVTKKGETNFTLDLSMLSDGDNDVEVRLFDKDGRLIGTQKSIVSSDENSKGPVYMVSPKMGATVLGAVEIKVGFGRELKNTYVSFFVNGQFKSMTNMAPYSFIWDTTREANGWHDVEAWIVDDTSNTYKTKKTKIFVQNPGGRSERVTTAVPTPPVTAPVEPATPTAKVAVAKVPTAKVAIAASPVVNVVPSVSLGVAATNPVPVSVGGARSMKAIGEGTVVSMGNRNIQPTVTTNVAKVAPIRSTIDIKVVNPKVTSIAAKVAPKLAVTSPNTVRGTRVNYTGTYSISLNSAPVVFDVQPWVQDGVPLTPFRALFEQAGGKVDWENLSKAVSATGMGKDVYFKIGDKYAKVNKIDVSMEMAPFIERGRAIVPLDFVRDSLNVDVQFDPATGHVLITSKKKN